MPPDLRRDLGEGVARVAGGSHSGRIVRVLHEICQRWTEPPGVRGAELERDRRVRLEKPAVPLSQRPAPTPESLLDAADIEDSARPARQGSGVAAPRIALRRTRETRLAGIECDVS